MTYRSRIVAAVLVSLICCALANAQADRAGAFLQICASSAPADRDTCLGYLRGFIDGIRVGDAARGNLESGNAAIRVICIPEGVTVDQIKRVVVKYVEDRPKELNKNWEVQVFGALLDAWRCK